MNGEIDEEAVGRARRRVVDKITELIGNTPLVRLRSFERELPGVEIWAKCEFMNPGGSVKDRAAAMMIADAVASGQLDPSREIIDSTSGNTGIAYSLIGGALGFRVTLVMPGNVSWARRKISEAFGTHLIFSSPMETGGGQDPRLHAARAHRRGGAFGRGPHHHAHRADARRAQGAGQSRHDH